MTTFYQFQRQFPDDEACLLHMMRVRYGGTEIDCPKCGVHGKFYRMTRERAYVCQHCKYQVHPTAGTAMHKTRLPLHKWFYAMFLFSTSRHGVAAKELERQLGVSYPTAWRMAKEIRKHMAAVDGDMRLGGLGRTVEADETLVGGKRKGAGRGYRANKTVVFGMIERGGDLSAHVVPDVKRRTLEPIIRANIKRGSIVHTDELRSYLNLATHGYTHQSVNHGVGEYVRGDAHTNTVEGFWARLKLSIRGTHVHVSAKYLHLYVKEFEYRYNRRQRPEQMFAELVSQF